VLLFPTRPLAGSLVINADKVAEDITLVVAEILQSWLDAGSERDVTFEDLGPAITDHVKGWAV
jgi:hypothetical protein